MKKYISQFEIDQMERKTEEWFQKIKAEQGYISPYQIEESKRKVDKWTHDLGIE